MCELSSSVVTPRRGLALSAFLAATCAGGALAVYLAVPETLLQFQGRAGLGLLAFTAMSVAGELWHVPLPRGSIAISYAATLPAFILYGTGGAVIVEVAGYLLGSVADRRGWRVKLFNCAQYALSVFLAATAFELVGGVRTTRFGVGDLADLAVFTSVYFVVNHFLVGMWFTLNHPRESVWVIWGEPAKWEALTYLVTAPLGLTVAGVFSSWGLLAAAGLFAVALAAWYFLRLALKLERLNRELRTLYEASISLGQTLELEAVKERIADIVGRLAPYDYLAVLAWDEVEQVLRPVEVRPAGGGTEGLVFRLGEGLVGDAAEALRIEVVHDVAADPRTRQALPESLAAASIAVVPMAAEKGLVGVLLLGSQRADAFTPEETRLLTIFAAQAGEAMSRALRFQEAKRLAVTDSKTGVYNYRFFYDRLIEEIRRHEAKARPLSVIFVDVDHLKEINDQYGHQAGDQVLIGLSTIIREKVRATDEVARYGGEEFVVLLPGATGPEALAVAERIRRVVEAYNFGVPGMEPGKVTICAGVATYPEHATEPADLILRADEAMYHGKHYGRNRVSLYAGASPAPDMMM